MSIARDFDDFKEEIELAFAQNACVEIELYSIIASVIRESKNKQKLSIRDVSSRKRSEISAKFYGLSGFPDFVLLERKKDQDAVIYGCIEAKMPTIALGDNDEQLLGHIKSFGKVIYTNGLNWKFFNDNEKCFDIELGSIEEGKIKAWGISETNEEYLRRAHAVCPVTVIENRYSMMARWYENLMPVCKELGITYVAFSPLANGALTGAYQSKKAFGSGEQDFRPDMPQYSEEGIKKTNELLEVVSQIGEKHHATNAQMSLAWMINKYDFIIPIPGSRKLDRLQSNFEAGNVELSQEEVKTIDDKLNTMEFKVFGGH